MDLAALITSKMFREGVLARIEDIIDEDGTIQHDDLAEEVESIIRDPSKIDLKVREERGRDDH